MVRGILYDAVVFVCGFDEPTGAFGAAIEVGNGDAVNRVFGEHIAQDSALEAIAGSLDLIHEYARLSLPEAYLARFEAGIAVRENPAGSDTTIREVTPRYETHPGRTALQP